MIAHGKKRNGRNGSAAKNYAIARDSRENAREALPPRALAYERGKLLGAQFAIKGFPELGRGALRTLQTQKVFDRYGSITLRLHRRMYGCNSDCRSCFA